MKKALTAPVQLWQLILIAIIVTSLTTTAAVSAAPLSAFLTPGTMRMAVAQVNPGPTVPKGYSNVAVIKQFISIPAGKVADLAVLGEVDMQGGATQPNPNNWEYCFGQYRLDNINTGTQFKPGNYILKGFTPPVANNLSVPINGYLMNVPAGAHTVYMVMEAGYQDCIINMGSMIVLANIH